jgi:hypothetical protein
MIKITNTKHTITIFDYYNNVYEKIQAEIELFYIIIAN